MMVKIAMIAISGNKILFDKFMFVSLV